MPAASATSLEQIARDGVVLAAAISEPWPGPHAPGHGCHPHRVGLANRRSQDVLHHVAGGHRSLRGGDLCRRRGHRSATPTRWCPPTRPASSCTTTGTRSACAPPAATPSRSRASSCRSPVYAAASGRATQLPYMERNLVPGLFHAAASLGIAESADAVARRGIAGRINGDAHPRMQVADNAVDLSASRAVALPRGYSDRRPPGREPGIGRHPRRSSRRCSPRPRPPRRSWARRPPAS